MAPLAIEKLAPATRAAVEQFLKHHPLSPAGRLRPRIGLSNSTWYALLGPSLEDGKAGFGATAVSALEAFNRNFGRTGVEKDSSGAAAL